MQILKLPLRTTCPPSCKCGSKLLRNWVHSSCQSAVFIDCKGNVSCQKGCMNVLQKNVGFQCQKVTGFQDYKTATQFLMSFAPAFQSSAYDLNDYQAVEFITSFNQNIVKKWHS